MSNMILALESLSDRDLLAEVHRSTERERQATARLIAALGELDARRLYLGEGCSSLFTYCTQVLHLSEHAAYRRIEAAPVARRYPLILELLANGSVTLTGIGLLASHLTPENHRRLLERARHQSKRAIEHLVAELHPKPDAPPVVQKLAVPKSSDAMTEAGEKSSAPLPLSAQIPPPARPAVLTPIAAQRYKVQFTVDAETYGKLQRAQALLRHVVPSGDLPTIFNRALTLLVAELERTKLSATRRGVRPSRPSADGSRHIPAAVKRAVWARDGGRCRFVGSHGRCAEQGGLEFHHVVPFAEGGTATVENIELRCRSHNKYEAEQWFGPLVVRDVQMCYSVRTGLPSK
jgi:HNH endonuclease